MKEKRKVPWMLLATTLIWAELIVPSINSDLCYEESPVNRYGSPKALPESTDHEEAGPSQVLPSRVVSSNE